MIAKVSKGRDFAGLMRYLTKDGRGKVLAMDNLSSTTPDDAESEMRIAADLSRRTKRPVLHVMISYAPGERPTDEEMRADGRDILLELGLSENQAVMIRHHDKSHAHFHIAANRVGPTGKTISDSKSYERVESALRRIEAGRSLSITLGRNAPEPVTGARKVGPRMNVDPQQHDAPTAVRDALLNAKSWDELNRHLGQLGWRLEITQKGKDRLGALLVGPDGQKVAAGKIDRDATLSRLRARLDRPLPRAATLPPTAGRGCTVAPAPGFARATSAALAKPIWRGKKRKDMGNQIKGVGGALSQLGEALVSAILLGKARTVAGRIARQGRLNSPSARKFGPRRGSLRPPSF